ncbi:MAG: hypothetical protein H0T46_08385 [Deltaproteobacteria bacterium]|nr:hypothetical protein [Deltaproteobacteria bacterium]
MTVSDDARPIPEPGARPYWSKKYLANVLVLRPMWEFFDRRTRRAAGDINAIEEVPDSTWFTNRIGVRNVSPEEAVKGPDVTGPPVLPFTITQAKRRGANPGFIAADARGVAYLVKFDTKSNPGQQTATDAIVGRILWTAGYNTPSGFVVYFRRDQLEIEPKLRAEGTITDATIDAILKVAAHRNDGAIRASASQILDGVPKNGWAHAGRRSDDPNDRVRHEHRRSLRGLRVLSAWLNHTDVKEDNTLDMYVGKPGEGHLKHYLVDFGEAFGGHQDENQQRQIGFEYAWDFENQLKAMFAFGLWYRPWEAQRPSRWKQVGMFNAINFDPHQWRERYPYTPFRMAEPADLYWGAKLVMRFDRPLLEAIVKTGELGDGDAERYVVDTLLARREAIGKAFLDGVTPLDEITLTNNQLCGVDLARRYGIARDGELRVDGATQPIGADGGVCIAVSVAPGYHLVRARIRRHDHTTPALEIHYVGGSKPHVVGLVR